MTPCPTVSYSGMVRQGSWTYFDAGSPNLTDRFSCNISHLTQTHRPHQTRYLFESKLLDIYFVGTLKVFYCVDLILSVSNAGKYRLQEGCSKG
jgi:hypothetical protein